MGKTFEIYVKDTSNCDGLPLQTFERLGAEWTGAALRPPLPATGDDDGQCQARVREDRKWIRSLRK